MAALKLSLLGPFLAALDEKPIDSFPTSKVQALLVFLAVERQAAHRREYLMELLWPGMPEPSARHNLRQALYQLRKKFPSLSSSPAGKDTVPFVLSDRRTIQINAAAAIETDVERVGIYLTDLKNHDHPDLLNCPTCRESLEAAVDLYRGDFLVDFYLDDSNQFEAWTAAQRDANRQQVLVALEILTTMTSQRQDFQQAQAFAERQIALDPLRERAHRALMTALAHRGRRRAALAHYETLREQLEAELSIDPSPETHTLMAAIREGEIRGEQPLETTTILSDGMASRLPTLQDTRIELPKKRVIRSNLPAQPTPFIGRETELIELEALIADRDTRLVTIVGPGGMGKTRLALVAAERMVETKLFPDGVFFVDLAPLNEPQQIPSAVAEVLQIQLSAGEGGARQQLLEFLRDKAMFFVMDNFEHLLDGAHLISDLLVAAPGIQVLATSRERLEFRQEQLYPISGLEFPDWVTPEDAAEYTAAQLFLGAARRMRPNFELEQGELAPLAYICRLVGGMPLALELSAGWVELLPLAEIAAKIERGLGFLESDLQDVPDRHRSIWTIFETTWERLEPTERDMMKKLSVFRSGFTREAARQVASDQKSSPASLRLLGRLVSKSLLQVDPSRERYQVHEMLRKFALERLDQSGEMVTTHTAHASYYLDMLYQLEAAIKGGRGQKDALDDIEADFANIRAAWNWALDHGNLEALDQVLEALLWFCKFRNRELEGVELFLRAEELLDPGTNRGVNPLWRRIAARRIYLDQFAWVGDYHEKQEEIELILAAAREARDQTEADFALFTLCSLQMDTRFLAGPRDLEESLASYRDLGASFFEVRVLDMLSAFYLFRGELEERGRIARLRLALADNIEDSLTKADALAQIGFVAELSGRYAEAEFKYKEALPIFSELVDRYHQSEYSALLGGLIFLKGEFDPARILVTEALALARQFNIFGAMIFSQGYLGIILCAEEKYEQAVDLCQNLARNDLSLMRFYCLRVMAFAQCGLGDFTAARLHLARALKSADYYKATGWQVQCLPAAAMIAASEDQFDRAIELLALSFHHPAAATGWLEKFPLVVRLRERLEAELPTETFIAAWERGKSLDLAATITALLLENLNESAGNEQTPPP